MNIESILGVHFTKSPRSTRNLAIQLAMRLNAGDTVALIGELGAGKTEFVRGIASAFGVEASVASPSFVRVHDYGGVPKLIHADFYLAKSEEDAIDYGLEESSTQGGIILIEWGDLFPRLLPQDCWRVHISKDDIGRNCRKIEISRRIPDNENFLKVR